MLVESSNPPIIESIHSQKERSERLNNRILPLLSNSLRSKRFRRAFRPLEAFFAFWLRKNWGERTFLRPPQLSRGQKSEKCIERAESLTETLATQAIVKIFMKSNLFRTLSQKSPIETLRVWNRKSNTVTANLQAHDVTP